MENFSYLNPLKWQFFLKMTVVVTLLEVTSLYFNDCVWCHVILIKHCQKQKFKMFWNCLATPIEMEQQDNSHKGSYCVHSHLTSQPTFHDSLIKMAGGCLVQLSQAVTNYKYMAFWENHVHSSNRVKVYFFRLKRNRTHSNLVELAFTELCPHVYT